MKTMENINRDIFKAIHDGKWLSIEYKNNNDQITSYWIGIQNLNPFNKTLSVEGFHLTNFGIIKIPFIYLDSILSANIVEGSYYPKNYKLIEDIQTNPSKYKTIFDNIPNLKILNYLELCNQLDNTPYKTDFKLLKYMDESSFENNKLLLSDEQFSYIVKNFQKETKQTDKMMINRLALNILSIYTDKGLYVLAYKLLKLDVKNKLLLIDDETIINTEFTVERVKQSITKFLEADDLELLNDFNKNKEIIKDKISQNTSFVDDMPYIINLGFDIKVDLNYEYRSILKMYEENNLSIPLKAFFGDLLERSGNKKTYSIALLNDKINLDQLLAINNAMKNPIAYIQGPPGTGKTNTIINTIATAFFNEKTVLFTSYNNHPIDSVYEKLKNITYKDKKAVFPIIRLGNNEKLTEAIEEIKNLYYLSKDIDCKQMNLNNKTQYNVKKLTNILKKYENLLDLKERDETINKLLEYNRNSTSMMLLAFNVDLADRQKNIINDKIKETGTINEEEALSLLNGCYNEFKKYLYYTGAKYIRKLDEPKNEELKDIIFNTASSKQVECLNKYLRDDDNLKNFLEIFPVVLTTCISAHKLGSPLPTFDMTIIDEASQCNNAISLIPIIRGKSLMLVGDPQQLNPVILLDKNINEKLKEQYMIKDEYDYCQNSIYKTFLACDSISDEILLSYHYRCHKKIIEYNNKKYYHSKLKVLSCSQEEKPLVYINVEESGSPYKNTSTKEAEKIIAYIKNNPDKSIGIITPFVNQKKLIDKQLEENNINHIRCGTIHAFQGDEKDEILFSTAITENTHKSTYNWLKNNKELINVASSRAKDRLIVLSNGKMIKKFHEKNSKDDLYELLSYVKTNGLYEITPRYNNSRALGIKPFSTETEEAFLTNLIHCLENIWQANNRFKIYKEVPISQVFQENTTYSDLFYSGRFDFVVYEKRLSKEFPVLAIELDGKEHYNDDLVMIRDKKKNEICLKHNLQLIRVDNTYARRYNHIKEILIDYFKKLR